MAYPYLPVNPCCTDVVLNDPCGCSSVITNSGCNSNDPCSTNLTASSTIVYDGLALSCIIAEPCDTLNVILQKIDQIICNLLTQINTLNIQVHNITTQITNINGDIININNQLAGCCNATTTSTTTAAPILCESFSLTNTGASPVAIIITDCDTGEQEAIVLLPGDTDICVLTDSPLNIPGGVIAVPNGPCGTTTTSTTLPPSTTTTTTTAFPCECLTFTNTDESAIDHNISYNDCLGDFIETTISATEVIKVCGCCGFADSNLVIISIGANCTDGVCPGEPTTTTTTTLEPTTTTTTTVEPTTTTTTTFEGTTTTTTTNGEPTTTTTTTVIPCDCLTFENTDTRPHNIGYTDCNDLPVTGINIDPSEIISFCGAHAVVSDPSVTVTVGEACVLGVCQTTTTTTTVEPTTTTTSTSSSTTTTTTTCNPATPHPFNITVVNGTSTVPDSGSFLVDACAAIECLQTSSCTVTSSFSVYFDVASPGIGDIVYAGSTGCTLGLVGYDGYFQINYGGIWTVVQIINSVIVDFPTCTTTTTTTVLCGNFSFQGLPGGGSWTGLDCYTGLAVGNSIPGGDTQQTGCIIISSLAYTNLESKGDAACDPTTTTTTTLPPA